MLSRFSLQMDSKFEEAVKSFNTTASLWKFYVQVCACLDIRLFFNFETTEPRATAVLVL